MYRPQYFVPKSYKWIMLQYTYWETIHQSISSNFKIVPPSLSLSLSSFESNLHGQSSSFLKKSSPFTTTITDGYAKALYNGARAPPLSLICSVAVRCNDGFIFKFDCITLSRAFLLVYSLWSVWINLCFSPINLRKKKERGEPSLEIGK